jgi:hypothetical protein
MRRQTNDPAAAALEKASGGPVFVISGVAGKGLPEVLRALMPDHRDDPKLPEDRPMAALTPWSRLISAAKRLVVKIGSALLVDRRTGLKQGLAVGAGAWTWRG